MQKYILKSDLIDFLSLIQSSDSFKSSCRQIWSRDKNNKFKEIFCYNQLKNGLEKCFDKFIVNSESDYYITKNSFYADKRSSECLFSLDNIVIDIDSHDGTLTPVEIEYNIRKLLFLLSFSYENQFPFPTAVVFTGRGCHLWLHIDSISSKLLFLYKVVVNHFCDVLSVIIADNDIDLSVDYTASLNAVGIVRMPFSFNSVNAAFVTAECYPECSYNIDDLISEYDISKNQIKIAPVPADVVPVSSDYRNLMFKRIRFIERYCVLHNFDLVGCRNNVLFLYYNCCCQVYSDAVERTEKLNSKFLDSLGDLSYIYNTVNKHFYKFTDMTFMEFLGLSEEEKTMYSNADRDEKRKLSKEDRNKQIYQLAVAGIKQADIAERVGCGIATVKRVLKDFNKSEFLAVQVRKLHSDGNKTQQEIADIFNISRMQVSRYLKKM